MQIDWLIILSIEPKKIALCVLAGVITTYGHNSVFVFRSLIDVYVILIHKLYSICI